MKKNLKNLFIEDKQYTKELIYFLMYFQRYFEEVKKEFPKDKVLQIWENLTEFEKKKWILEVFIPDFDKKDLEKHIKKSYILLHLQKGGRYFLKYYKENEPERI